MKRKTVVAFSMIVVVAGLLAHAPEADARMMGMGGGRMMAGGFHRPMMQPMGPMRSGFAAGPRTQRFYPTVGNFEVVRSTRPSASKFDVYDYPGGYPGRFDGVKKGRSAGGVVGGNETITIHGNRTDNINVPAARRPSSHLFDGGGFRGGVGVASSGKSSTWIRVGQPHTGGSMQRNVRHREGRYSWLWQVYR